jgi:hypothetical protein
MKNKLLSGRLVVALWLLEQAETGQSHVVVAETLEVGHAVTMVAPDHIDEVLGGWQGGTRVPTRAIAIPSSSRSRIIPKQSKKYLFFKICAFRVPLSINMVEETKVPCGTPKTSWRIFCLDRHLHYTSISTTWGACFFILSHHAISCTL